MKRIVIGQAQGTAHIERLARELEEAGVGHYVEREETYGVIAEFLEISGEKELLVIENEEYDDEIQEMRENENLGIELEGYWRE